MSQDRPGAKVRSRPNIPLSGVKEMRWPAVAGGEAASLLAMLYQLRQTQWWEPEQILRMQFAQLQGLVGHAWQTVPFYRQRFEQAGIDPQTPLDMQAWRRFPILSRADLQQHRPLSNAIPPSHGKVYETQTSGSTGEPVKLSGTALTQMFWRAFTLRDHEWQQRDFRGRLAVIRAPGLTSEPVLYPNWGVPVSLIYRSGESGILSLTTDISRQMAWLADFNPDYILSFPSNLMALIEYSQQHGIRLPALREVRTISENVSDRLRDACRDIWKVHLVDSYSSQEFGYMAIQCPEHPHLHVQSENVLLEILDEQGEPCPPGRIGRIVVTSLNNFATPLIRYELRDRAEAGGMCSCGRGLPVINRIVGRERNMLQLPNGETRWPMTGYQKYGNITPAIRQFQFIQHSYERVEVRLVVTRPLDETETAALRKLIQESLGHPFEIEFTFMDRLPRSPSGKFEEFISRVTPPGTVS